MSSDNRPTSPHLTIYRPQITSVLSIMHRITGLILVAGTALMVSWLYVAAYSAGDYSTLHDIMATPLAKICLMGWTLAFYYHLGNGIRHLFWDIGKGFTIPQATRSGWAVLLFTVLMAGLTWCPYLITMEQ